MIGRLVPLWGRLRESLWFLPLVLTITGAVVAVAVTEFERNGGGIDGTIGGFLYGGGAAGARGVLSAIASSLITVTGVVFSVTIVALQLASSQYTPRLLRDFTADRGNQVVLGVFIGTFTYTLLVLRTVRAAAEDGAAFVPAIAVTLSIVLAIVNIGFLIFFIDHSAQSIQLSTILARVTRRTHHDIRDLFPQEIGDADPAPPAPPRRPDRTWPVGADRSGYLQRVDARALFETGEEASLLILMDVEVGSFVVDGTPLAHVSGPPSDDLARRIRSAFVVGSQRTPGQDVEFGLIEISDIAVKALSPGINDPTTAVHCIHRIGELLIHLGTRSEPQPIRTAAGAIHFVARHPSFEDLARRTLAPVWHFGCAIPMVVLALLSMLRMVHERLAGERRAAIASIAADVFAAAHGRLEREGDRAQIEAAIAAF